MTAKKKIESHLPAKRSETVSLPSALMNDLREMIVHMEIKIKAKLAEVWVEWRHTTKGLECHAPSWP